ncbi:MAG: hypothetical protein NDF55_08460 [archaeon GB-1867-005]|nr:hypothetical protein [Candidatus Culexmicrobium cathedralense]
MSEKELKLYPLRKRIIGLPQPFKPPTSGILKYGHVPRLSGFLQRTRSKLGLSKAPPTAYQVKEAVEEVQNIIRTLKLDIKFAWDWKKKRFQY